MDKKNTLEEPLSQGHTLSRRSLFGGACLCCLPALQRRAEAAGMPRPATVTEVAAGLHVRRGLTEEASDSNEDAIANIGFIVGRDAVAVIDPGGSLEDGESLRLAIREVTKLPIRYVVMSHIHPDHIFGAAAFQPDQPVFVGHAALPAQLVARGEFYRQGLEKILGAGRAGPVVAPTLLVRDRAELDLGGRVLSLTGHRPAHTVCDLSVVDQQSGILLTGDLLFVDRVPALDGDLKGWLAELAALKELARHAVPGHGPVLVPMADAAAALERYLRVLLEETRAAIAKGVPIEDAAITVALSERGNWQMFDDYNGRNVMEAYRRLEWE